jgi:hypothetical protein
MRRLVLHPNVALLVLVLGARAYGLGADHPKDRPVILDQAPPGLSDLINQKERVHGYFVNAEDRFFFAGDTAAFNDFIQKYAMIDGMAGHRLTIHKGKGRAKSPWDKGEGRPCDWMMDVALVSWVEGYREVFKDPEVAASKTQKPKYLAEVHVWAEGNVDLSKVKIPASVNVVREQY